MKLAPCPFCGAPARLLPHLGGPECPYVTCSAECYIGDLEMWAEDWNRRTPPPRTAAVFETWRAELARCKPDEYVPQQIKDILAEWPEPAKEPAHE